MIKLLRQHTLFENIMLLLILCIDLYILGAIDLFDPLYYAVLFIAFHSVVCYFYIRKGSKE